MKYLNKDNNIIQAVNLRQCEKAFIKEVEEINIIGDIILSEKEFEHIKNLLKENLTLVKDNPSYLEREAPLTVSIFLVWIGIKEYKEGIYWESIYESLEIKENNSKWNSLLGDIFYYTLNKYNLYMFNVGRNKYVSQILCHGFIPNNYLNEFFVSFLYKEFYHLINQEISLTDVKQKLKYLRENNQRHNDLNQKIIELKQKEKKVTNDYIVFKKAYEKWDKLVELSKIYQKRDYNKNLKELFTFPEEFLEMKKGILEKIEDDIKKIKDNIALYDQQSHKLLKQQKEHIKIKQDLSCKRNQVIILKNELNDVSQKLLKKTWNDSLEERITSISLIEFKDRLNEYNNIFNNNSTNFTNIIEFIKHITNKLKIIYFKIIGREEKMRNSLLYLLNGLPVKEELKKSLSNEIYNTLNNIIYLVKEIKKKKGKIKTMQELLFSKEIDVNQIKDKLEVLKGKKENITNDLKDLNKSKESISKEIIEYKKKLTIISGGVSYKEGLKYLEEQRIIKKNIDNFIKELGLEKDYLLELLQIINENEQKNINNKIIHIEANLKSIKKQKKEINEKLVNYPEKLSVLIESTRIFLLENIKDVENFIYECLKAFKKIKDMEYNDNLKLDSCGLQPHIVRNMVIWWKKYSEELDDKKTYIFDNKIKINNPYIKYSREENTLLIYIPEQVIETYNLVNPEVILNVINDKKEIINKKNFRLFKVDNKLIKTAAEKIKIRNSNNLTLEILNDGKLIRSWKLTKDNYYFLKSDEIIKNNYLKGDKLTLIIKDSFNIEPDDIIIQKERLAYDCSEYVSLYLNTSETKVLIIKDDKDNIIETITEQKKLTPKLIAGNISKECSSKRGTIYWEKAPKLIFTTDNFDNLNFWQLRIAEGEDIKYFEDLEKIENVTENNKIITISLEKFFRYKYGVYNITLFKRDTPSKTWTFEFIILPQIKIDFDKDIYPLAKDEKEKGLIHLEIPGDFTYKAKDIKVIRNYKGEKMDLEFSYSQEKINGILALKNKNSFTIDLAIHIPNLYWKFEGENLNTDWSRKQIEIWYEDLLNQKEASMLIKKPFTQEINGELILGKDIQRISKKIINNICTFDLLQFSDSLRHSQLKLQNLSFKIKEKLFDVIDIRTQWEVNNIVIKQEQNKKIRKLEIKWKEKGKAKNRVIRLWNLNTRNLILTKNIRENENTIIIKVLKEKLPLGYYRMQFTQQEVWGIKEKVLPDKTDINICDFVIGKKAEFINKMKKFGLIIKQVVDESGNKYNLQVKSLIDNIRLASNLEFEREERYVGELIFLKKVDGELEVKKMEYNPISFYFNLEEEMSLPFLVDLDRDGATFCKKCKQLFWSVKACQEHKDEEQFLPVKFYVKIKREVIL